MKEITYTNSLAYQYPSLASEWHPTKNGTLSPMSVLPGSNKKVWWICDKMHEWKATVNHRALRKQNCPFCSGRYPIVGSTDFQTQHPELLDEWDFENNQDVLPTSVTSHSNKKVWWKCRKCSNRWIATVSNRVEGRGCPSCSREKRVTSRNQALIGKKGSLQDLRPDLATEWNIERNDMLSPSTVTTGSNKKIWWKCVNQHEWRASVVERVNGTGCPVCSKQNRTSFAEQAIYYYIKQMYPDALNGFTDIFQNSMELDIFIPSMNTAIEYDGAAWHNSQRAFERELSKYKICKAHNITLYRVKEKQTQTDTQVCDVVIYTCNSLDDTIQKLAKLGLSSSNIDCERDRAIIREQYMFLIRDKSIASKYPNIAQTWHPTKNGLLRPEMFSYKSGESAWWLCEHGHEWVAIISQRTSGHGCPYCTNQKVLKSYNDLLTLRPDIAKQWHPSKNEGLLPSMVTVGSGKSAWWIGECGHEWKSSIKARTNETGCPYCAKKIVIEGKTDLATTAPELAKEWHPTKNAPIDPTMVTPHSSRKVWWICEKGHEWNASIDNRSKGKGCPYCSNKSVLIGFNDFETLYPNLAKQWHPLKNNELLPSMVVPNSGKKVWWHCTCGHDWEAAVKTRVKGHGCPVCGRKQGVETRKTKRANDSE